MINSRTYIGSYYIQKIHLYNLFRERERDREYYLREIENIIYSLIQLISREIENISLQKEKRENIIFRKFTIFPFLCIHLVETANRIRHK